MQVKSIAECSKWEHSAILLTCIKLLFVIKMFVLSIFEWPFYTGFTVLLINQGEHSAILSTFIKLPLVIKIYVLSIFEWLIYTGFTVPNTCELAYIIIYHI